jgi:predicted Fe-S protein YdhL (DUF1289 family)
MSEIDNVSSPCVGVCQYTEEDICRGCFRTFDEISKWSSMNEEERLVIMKVLNERMDSIF